MAKFKVGDRVVLVDAKDWVDERRHYIGLETVVVDTGPHSMYGHTYDVAVDTRDGLKKLWLFDDAVRKIDDGYDGDKAGDWDLCPWRPGQKIKLRTPANMDGAIRELKRIRESDNGR